MKDKNYLLSLVSEGVIHSKYFFSFSKSNHEIQRLNSPNPVPLKVYKANSNLQLRITGYCTSIELKE